MSTEDPSLAPPDQPSKLTTPCGVCRRAVIKARQNGRPILVEFCKPRTGNLGLVASLIGPDQLEAIKTTATATKYREHRCLGTEAFSAQSFGRKKAPLR
jgi:hypothetical protein